MVYQNVEKYMNKFPCRYNKNIYNAQSQLNQEQHHAFTKIMQTIDVGTTAIHLWMDPGELQKCTYTVHYWSRLNQEV